MVKQGVGRESSESGEQDKECADYGRHVREGIGKEQKKEFNVNR
jgi:hypothetical protein